MSFYSIKVLHTTSLKNSNFMIAFLYSWHAFCLKLHLETRHSMKKKNPQFCNTLFLTLSHIQLVSGLPYPLTYRITLIFLLVPWLLPYILHSGPASTGSISKSLPRLFHGIRTLFKELWAVVLNALRLRGIQVRSSNSWENSLTIQLLL